MSVNFILRCFYVAKLNKFVFDNFVFILSVLTLLFKVFCQISENVMRAQCEQWDNYIFDSARGRNCGCQQLASN
jgi:hypothetical protein